MKRSIRTALYLLAAFATNAGAGDATEQLNFFFKHVNSLRAEFTQVVIGEALVNAEESKGTVEILRPGKFRWLYKKPYEQQFVADGKKLWVYDVDMEQVIVKPLNLVLGTTPAVLLSGNANITEQFEIAEIASRDVNNNAAWLELTPKNKDSGFEKLRLAFAGNDITTMELTDAFGQTTRLNFWELERNPKLDASIFNFEPPRGVDVITDTKSE